MKKFSEFYWNFLEKYLLKPIRFILPRLRYFPEESAAQLLNPFDLRGENSFGKSGRRRYY